MTAAEGGVKSPGWRGGPSFARLGRWGHPSTSSGQALPLRELGYIRLGGDGEGKNFFLDGGGYELGFVVDVEFAHQVEFVRFYSFQTHA